MPELPDITVYVESLEAKLRGDTLRRVRRASLRLVAFAQGELAAPHRRSDVIGRLARAVLVQAGVSSTNGRTTFSKRST